MKKKSNLKNIILSIIIIVCVALDVWGIYIRLYGQEKVAPYTFKIGQQTATAIDPETGEVTEDSRWFAEVNIYDNCYEILFNYFTDENATEFYSQGLQFYTNNDSVDLQSALNENVVVESDISLYFKDQNLNKISTTLEITETKKFLLSERVYQNVYDNYYNILSNKKYSKLTVSNFASSNKYEDTIYSSNPLNENSFFTIQMGKDIYYMKLRGSDYKYLSLNKNFCLLQTTNFKDWTDEGFFNTALTKYYDRTTYYRTCDIYYLAEVIYNSCQGLQDSSGDRVITFEFGDYFNYYSASNNTSIITDNNINDKIINFVKSYYQIKVNKHSGNMTKASQSLFGVYKGSTSYNESESDEAGNNEVFTDYHHGKTILDLNENYFDTILTKKSNTANDYRIYLSLKSEFKACYPASKIYRLRVTIDLDNINCDNVEFSGFIDDTFNGYIVYQINTIELDPDTGELNISDITQEVLNV